MKQYTSKSALVAAMREQITRDEPHVRRALIRIYNNQVGDEKRSRSVRYRNGKGFKPQDAKMLTGIACWVIAGHTLTERQFNAVRQRIVKYAAQLVDQAIEWGWIQKRGREYVYGSALKAA